MFFFTIDTAMTQPPRLESFLIGAYTSAGGSEGAYTCTLDPETGEFGPARLVGRSSNPSFAVWGKDGKTVYVIEEAQGAHVRGFKLTDGKTWADLGSSKWDGNGPCHLALSHDGRFVAGAGYGDGTLGFFGLEPDGRLTPALASFRNSGSGPVADRQEGPHMHFAAFSPDDKFVLACDLGTDEVLSFPVQGGQLGDPVRTKTHAGAGPRHLVFNKAGDRVYVNGELDNTLMVFRRDPATGAMREVLSLSTIPKDFAEYTKTSEIVMHPDGRTVYVSNRGHESVAAFTLDAGDKVSLLGIYPAGVKEPRGMDIDPTGRWMVVAGQNSGDIVSLPCDPVSHGLGAPKGRLPASRAVCITFRR